MNEKEKLKQRVVRALRATDRYSGRGPKTFAARVALADWLGTDVFRKPGYLAMTTPAEACKWLEYVATAERGRARIEAMRRKAAEAEEWGRRVDDLARNHGKLARNGRQAN